MEVTMPPCQHIPTESMPSLVRQESSQRLVPLGSSHPSVYSRGCPQLTPAMAPTMAPMPPDTPVYAQCPRPQVPHAPGPGPVPQRTQPQGLAPGRHGME